jgi:hypothetical protein
MSNKARGCSATILLVSLQLAVFFPELQRQSLALDAREGEAAPLDAELQQGQPIAAREGALVTKEQAIEAARKWAKEKGLEVEDYRAEAWISGDHWAVRLTPSQPGTLGGDLTIVLDRKTGKFVEGSRGQ